MRREWKRAFGHPIFWLGIFVMVLSLYGSARLDLWDVENYGQSDYLLRGMEYAVTSYPQIYKSSLMNYALWLWPFWVGVPYLVDYAMEGRVGFDHMMNLRLGKKGVYEGRKLRMSGLVSCASVVLPLLIYLAFLGIRLGHFGKGQYVQELVSRVEDLEIYLTHPKAIFHQLVLLGLYGGVLGILGAIFARKFEIPLFSYLFVPAFVIGQGHVFMTLVFLTGNPIWKEFVVLGIYTMQVHTYVYVILEWVVLALGTYALYCKEKRKEVIG